MTACQIVNSVDG